MQPQLAAGAGAASQPQLGAAGALQASFLARCLAKRLASNFGRDFFAHGSASQPQAGAASHAGAGAGAAQGAGSGAAHGAGAGSQQEAAAPEHLAAIFACKRAIKPTRFGAGAQAESQAGAGAGAAHGAGATSQAGAAGAQQSLLRWNNPAEALDEETTAQATTVKATKIRRIRISPKTVRVHLRSRHTSLAQCPPGWPVSTRRSGSVDATT